MLSFAKLAVSNESKNNMAAISQPGNLLLVRADLKQDSHHYSILPVLYVLPTILDPEKVYR